MKRVLYSRRAYDQTRPDLKVDPGVLPSRMSLDDWDAVYRVRRFRDQAEHHRYLEECRGRDESFAVVKDLVRRASRSGPLIEVAAGLAPLAIFARWAGGPMVVGDWSWEAMRAIRDAMGTDAPLLVVFDATALPFRSSCAAVVCTRGLLYALEDDEAVRVLQEQRRICLGGGYVLTVERGNITPLDKVMWLLRLVLGRSRREAASGACRKIGYVRDRGALRSLVRRAGLFIVTEVKVGAAYFLFTNYPRWFGKSLFAEGVTVPAERGNEYHYATLLNWPGRTLRALARVWPLVYDSYVVVSRK